MAGQSLDTARATLAVLKDAPPVNMPQVNGEGELDFTTLNALGASLPDDLQLPFIRSLFKYSVQDALLYGKIAPEALKEIITSKDFYQRHADLVETLISHLESNKKHANDPKKVEQLISELKNPHSREPERELPEEIEDKLKDYYAPIVAERSIAVADPEPEPEPDPEPEPVSIIKARQYQKSFCKSCTYA